MKVYMKPTCNNTVLNNLSKHSMEYTVAEFPYVFQVTATTQKNSIKTLKKSNTKKEKFYFSGNIYIYEDKVLP